MRRFVDLLAILLIVLLLMGSEPLVGLVQGASETPTYILFVFDSSGSMRKVMADKKSRLTIAKEVMDEVLVGLPDMSNLHVGLRVYGAGLVPENPCRDSVLVHKLAPIAQVRTDIVKTIKGLRPVGMTPIAYSLEEAGKDFPLKADARNIIVLITDGAESCRGNPCEVSLSLQQAGVIIEPYVVGFDLAAEEASLVACIGKYFSASDGKSLKDALSAIMVQVIAPTALSVQSQGGGEILSAQTTFEVLGSNGGTIKTLQGKEGDISLTADIPAGQYVVRGHYPLGPETLTATSPPVHLSEGETIPVLLDFGPLTGTVTVLARAGQRDISDAIDIVVKQRGQQIAPIWAAGANRTTLPAGSYDFTVTYREDAALSRTVTAWVSPNKNTDVLFEFGELPATLGVKATYGREDVTIQSTLEVRRNGQISTSIPQGASQWLLEQNSGTVDITVRFHADVVAEKVVSGIVLNPGEDTQVVVDFGDILGTLRVKVMADEKDVTAESQVKADGRESLGLPLRGSYRQAILPIGAYVLEGKNPDAVRTEVVEALVKAGEITDVVMKLVLPGSIRVQAFLGDVEASYTDVEIHVYEGNSYKGQLTPCSLGGLRLLLAPGTYRVVGRYLGADQQTIEIDNVQVTSNKITDLTMKFAGVSALVVNVVCNDQPWDASRVDVYDLQGEYVESLSWQEKGKYFTELPEGTYNVQVVPEQQGWPEIDLPNLEVKSGRDTVVTASFGSIGRLTVKVLVNGAPYDPHNYEVFGQDGEWIAHMTLVEKGLLQADLPAGSYDIRILPIEQGWAPVVLKDVEIKGGQEVARDAIFGGTGKIQVYVSVNDQPYDPHNYEVFDAEGEWVSHLEWQEKGSFFAELPAGVYTLRFTAVESGWQPVVLHDVEILSGQTVTKEVMFGGTGKLSVKVTANDKPYEPYSLVVLDPEGEWVAHLEETGQKGVYAAELPAGAYSVEIVPEEQGWPPIVLRDVEVSSGQTVSKDASFGGIGKLIVRVTSNDKPYELYNGEVLSADGEWVCHFEEQATGSYYAELQSGVYDVILMAHEDGIGQITLENVEIVSNQSVTKEVRMDYGTIQLNIKVGDYYVEVVEVLKDDEWITYLEEADSDIWEGKLGPGVYDLHIVYDGEETWVYGIDLQAKQTKRVNLTLE